MPAICNICGETFDGVGPGRQWGHDTNVCAATTPPRLRARIVKLEGDLSIARLQLRRIDEELIGRYGEIETMPVKELRRVLGSIAYIVKPTATM